jgi:hypothetical protein
MSGRKNFLAPHKVITDGDMSLTLTAPLTDISYMDNLTLQAVWTGDAVGRFGVEGSHDGTNWVEFVFSLAATGSPLLIDMNQLSFPKMRFVYTPDTGTGVLNVTVSGKML